MYLDEGSQVHLPVKRPDGGLHSQLAAFLEASGAEVLEGGQPAALDLDVQTFAVAPLEEVSELLSVLFLVPPVVVKGSKQQAVNICV